MLWKVTGEIIHHFPFIPVDQEYAYPAVIQERTGISKTIQILYKNEEVEIGDFFIFKVYVLVDSKKVNIFKIYFGYISYIILDFLMAML